MPYWPTLFGPARKNKRNRERWRTMAASPAPTITRNRRRNKRQAIAKLAHKVAQPVAGERYRARHWARLEKRNR